MGIPYRHIDVVGFEIGERVSGIDLDDDFRSLLGRCCENACRPVGDAPRVSYRQQCTADGLLHMLSFDESGLVEWQR